MTIFNAPEILLVDDDPMNIDILSRRLSSRGYTISTANSGAEALSMISVSTPDLVLLDLVMPGMDGHETLARIRRDLSPAELPVIIATALDSPDEIVRAFERGANDYVTKPFDFPVVFARLAVQVSLSRARAATAFANSLLKVAIDAGSVGEILEKSAPLILELSNASACCLTARGIDSSASSLNFRHHGTVCLSCKGASGRNNCPCLERVAESFDQPVHATLGDINRFPESLMPMARISEGGGSLFITLTEVFAVPPPTDQAQGNPFEILAATHRAAGHRELMITPFGTGTVPATGTGGVAILSSKVPGAFTDPLARAVESCLSHFTLGIRRVCAEESLRRHNENLEALVEERVAETRAANESLIEENRQRRTAEIKMLNNQIMLEHSRAELKKFTGRVLETREEEKKSLSTALHHEIGSLAVSISASLSAAADELKAEHPQEALAKLDSCRARVRESVGALKKIALDLRPPDLDIIGLPEALREMAATLTRDSNATAEVEICSAGPWQAFLAELDDRTAITVYRTAQESICNALKHGAPRNISLRLEPVVKVENLPRSGVCPGTRTDDLPAGMRISMEVSDDGIGFDRSCTSNDGIGLRAMAEMAEGAGGTISIVSSPGTGTRVLLDIPCHQRPRKDENHA